MALFDRMDGPMAIVASEGRIIAKSADMTALVGNGGTVFCDKQGRLAFRDMANQKAWARTLAMLAVTSGPGTTRCFSVERESQRMTAVVQPLIVQPEGARADPKSLTLLLAICGVGSMNGVPLDLLRLHHGLSKAESAVAGAIACGKNVVEASESLGISEATARNQLAAAMTKIGVRRQAAVVTAVASLTPRLRLGPVED